MSVKLPRPRGHRICWVAAGVALLLSAGCGGDDGLDAFTPAFDAAQLRPQVNAFCGDCHAVPKPEHFPKKSWTHEVRRGYELYFMTGRNDLQVPLIHEVVEYYRSQAPDDFPDPSATAATRPPIEFRAQPSSKLDEAPATSHVRWVPQLDRMVFCNMRSGLVAAADSSLELQTIGQLNHPAHLEPCDLNDDGRLDFVAAELGSFKPEDHDRGAVIWLKATDNGFETVPLQSGLARVADVQPGDFDGDGRTDLMVAEFGWLATGRVLLLINEGLDEGTPKFAVRVVDDRHGAIHVPPVDLNNDGRLDFVAVFGQEYETIDAYLNDGQGFFQRERIHDASNAAYGSSGIQLVDLDGDNDVDVLYTNGDTFDSVQVRPYHGVQWLENRGDFPFTHHSLAAMAGAHRALAADLDQDGDLDVAAVAMLPERTLAERDASKYDSVIWLEQTKPGTFTRHRLEASTLRHASLEIGDFDGDGDPDLAVGNFFVEEAFGADAAPLTVWWNQGQRKADNSGTQP